MRFLIFVFPIYASAVCTGSLFLGGASVGGHCMNSSCQATWTSLTSSLLTCDHRVQAMINGSVSGTGTGFCNSGFTTLQLGSGPIELLGVCSDGKMFRGTGQLMTTPGFAKCQDDGAVSGTAYFNSMQVTGNCN